MKCINIIKKVFKFFLFFLLLIFIGCNPDKRNAEYIIKKSEGNKKELEKVISYYKKNGDKEKLKAAYFLIGNMNDKYGSYGDIINNYYSVFKTLHNLSTSKTDIDTINKIISQQWDSIQNKVGAINNINFASYYDYQVISADFIIENIDYAFKAWKEKPWSKQYDFEQFCKFILPYRLFDESLQKYRKFLFDEFSWIEDSIKDKTNPIEVCQIVNDFIAKNFVFCNKFDKFPLPGAIDMYKLNGGTCQHRYLIVGSILRSLGIPICIDFAQQFNNNAIGHSWLVTIDKNGKFIAFNGGEPGIKISDTVKFPIIGVEGATKVFRITFDETNLKVSKKEYNELIPAFKNKHINDVSNSYKYKQASITFDVSEYNKDFVYICSFGYGLNFIPTYYSKPSNGKVKFENIGCNCVYFIADIQSDNNLNILSNPIYLKGDSIVRLDPDFSETQEIVLTRKFLPAEYNYKMYRYASWLKGAKFQASNDKNFIYSTTFYEINRNDYLSYTEKKVKLDKSYRYYRYLASDTGNIRLAELGFISDEVMRNKPTVYGYINREIDKTSKPVFEYAFDNDISTNLNAPSGSWVGLDFKKEVKLNKVYFLIRNDLNAVEIGDTYELFYFDKGWKSLGQTVANDYYLKYTNVPKNTLLLLKDLSKGYEERIFIYSYGKQVWL